MCDLRRLVILASLALAPPAVAGAAAANQGVEAYRAAYGYVLDESWTDAERAFSAFVDEHPSSEWADDAAFWRCYARERARMDPGPTFECYLELRDRWPDSEWADDAERAAVSVARRLAREGDDSYLGRVRGFEPDDEGTTVAVLAALAEVGDAASVQAILDRLEQTADPRLRAEMVEILKDAEPGAATDAIVRLARTDPAPQVRETAVEVIADLDGAPQLKLLAEIARTDPHPGVRTAATWGLGERGDERALPLLKELARGADPEVAEAAVEAIAESGWSGTLDFLEQLFAETGSAALRRSIIDGIADAHRERALPWLRDLVGSDIPDIAEAAIEGLGEIEHPDAVSALDEAVRTAGLRSLRLAAVDALAEHESPAAFEALLRILETAADSRVRAAAAEGLGWREDDRAVEPLARAARLDPDPGVRASATEALGDIGSARARDALIELLHD